MGCWHRHHPHRWPRAIEQNHDEQGIIWPDAMAPFSVLLMPFGLKVARKVETIVREEMDRSSAPWNC